MKPRRIKTLTEIRREANRLEKLALKCQRQRSALYVKTIKMRDDLLDLQNGLANIIVSLRFIADD